MTAAERAIIRLEMEIRHKSIQHEHYMKNSQASEATRTFVYLRGICDAVAILRDEIKRERKQ
jgi:hypothetical protein